MLRDSDLENEIIAEESDTKSYPERTEYRNVKLIKYDDGEFSVVSFIEIRERSEEHEHRYYFGTDEYEQAHRKYLKLITDILA